MKPTARYTNWDDIQPFLLAVKPPGWQYCLLQRKNKKHRKKNNLCVWAWRLRACGFGWQAPKVLFHFQIHAVVSQSDRLIDRFIRIFLTLDLQLDLLLFFFSCADGVSRNGLCTSCNADGDNGPKSNKISAKWK